MHFPKMNSIGMSSIDLSPYLEKEYDVECGEGIVRLKPVKAWILAPKGRPGVVIGLFKCPDGKTVRKALGKIEKSVE